jgi:hypothetical protein
MAERADLLVALSPLDTTQTDHEKALMDINACTPWIQHLYTHSDRSFLFRLFFLLSGSISEGVCMAFRLWQGDGYVRCETQVQHRPRSGE